MTLPGEGDMPRPTLTAVTLGVRDVPVSARFYEALGFTRKFRATGDDIAFFEAGGIALVVWDWKRLADDVSEDDEPRPSAFRGTTLAWNCTSPEEVDAALEQAIAAGARLLREASKTDYGGY